MKKNTPKNQRIISIENTSILAESKNKKGSNKPIYNHTECKWINFAIIRYIVWMDFWKSSYNVP